MSALTDIDLLPPDVNIGDTGHEKWHDKIHSGLIALKGLVTTIDSTTIKNSGAQTIADVKTFSSSPLVPTATTTGQAVNKGQMDTALSGKTDTGHVHSIANITSLQTTLDGKAPLSHTHTIANVTNLQSSLDAKLPINNPTLTGNLTTSGSGVFFSGTTKASLITEASNTIVDFGSNYWQAGDRVNAYRGAYFRIDTRDSNAYEVFSVTTQEPNVVQPQETKILTLSNDGYLTVAAVQSNTLAPTAPAHLTRKDYVDTSITNAMNTGLVKTTTDQTIAGIKSFTSAPRLTTTSTSGYAWVATDSSGNGAWSAIVNAPGGTVPWANITGKPSTFTPESHVHAISDITNLTTTLSGKVDTTRTVAAGTGLTGGGDLSANRTLAVVYGTTAASAAQGNDARLSDTRTPSPLSVVTSTIADANITLPKLATTARPYDFSFVQSLDTRAVGYGEMLYGTRIAKSIVITAIRYRLGTADASGTTTAQIYTSASASAANTALAGTSGTAAIDPTAVTGSFSIAAGTHFYVYTSAIGTTPGKGLVVEIEAYLA